MMTIDDHGGCISRHSGVVMPAVTVMMTATGATTATATASIGRMGMRMRRQLLLLLLGLLLPPSKVDHCGVAVRKGGWVLVAVRVVCDGKRLASL